VISQLPNELALFLWLVYCNACWID